MTLGPLRAFTKPAPYIACSPNSTGLKGRYGDGESTSPRELIDALAADPERSCDLGGTHQLELLVGHGWNPTLDDRQVRG